MSQNVAVYAELIKEAKAGREGAERALRSFLRNAADKMPSELLVGVSEDILCSMREKLRLDSRLN